MLKGRVNANRGLTSFEPVSNVRAMPNRYPNLLSADTSCCCLAVREGDFQIY